MSHKGLKFTRTFIDDIVDFVPRRAEIRDSRGAVIFEQDNVRAPVSWSDQAVNIVASKFFHGAKDSPDRESSVAALVGRVAETIADRGWTHGYFADPESRMNFADDLWWLCVNQYGSFNSPVWFNVGVKAERSEGWCWDEASGGVRRVRDDEHRPQASACFIQSVADDMESICALATSEMMLFKRGSGTGTDLSPLRSTKERLSGGGKPSGPVSFLAVYDEGARVVKSGGKSRRAAKMNTLLCYHPDILEFIDCKANEEKKAQALIRAGYDGSFNGEAYDSVKYQNVNISVGVTADFMSEAEIEATGIPSPSGTWKTRAVTSDATFDTGMTPLEILDRMAAAAWECGDPGVHYLETMNHWNTCPNSGDIHTTNPCSEYVFLNDSACNLASLNLMKFRREDGSFDVKRFQAAVRIFITAQEILVDLASYPTAKIAENSHRFRPLGLGYCNIGALLMSLGLPYDSDEGRDLAAAITGLMTATAYTQSAILAAALGPFDGFEANQDDMLRVVGMHADSIRDLTDRLNSRENLDTAAGQMIGDLIRSANEMVLAGEQFGYRNAQATLLAPTGTIAFMMDADTTGIEPAYALVAYKTLAGGGAMKIVNRTVPMALESLGYYDNEIEELTRHIDKHGSLYGSRLRAEHLPVFDCASPDPKSGRCLSWRSHLEMMAAVQPFLSGAISKTINMPSDATPEDIREAYLVGWRLGLKAVAIYRDGSKGIQPLSTRQTGTGAVAEVPTAILKGPDAIPDASPATSLAPARIAAGHRRPSPARRRLPRERTGRTVKVEIGGHEGYMTVNTYEDGTPGEVFFEMSEEGSLIDGFLKALGKILSLYLQYGCPLDVVCEKLAGDEYGAMGPTGDPKVPMAKSFTDYVGRKLPTMFPEDPGGARSDSEDRIGEVVLGEQLPADSPVLPGDLVTFGDGQLMRVVASKDTSSPAVVAFQDDGVTVLDPGSGYTSLPDRITPIQLQDAVHPKGSPAVTTPPSRSGRSCSACGAGLPARAGCVPCSNCGTTTGACA